jgi:hypothetical protein
MTCLEILTFCYQNVTKLNSKTQEFYVNNLSNGYDIMIIMGTSLHNGVHDNELFNNDYKVYQNDTWLKKKGGEVLIAIQQDIISSNIRLEDNNLEALCVEVKLYGKIYYTRCVKKKTELLL